MFSFLQCLSLQLAIDTSHIIKFFFCISDSYWIIIILTHNNSHSSHSLFAFLYFIWQPSIRDVWQQKNCVFFVGNYQFQLTLGHCLIYFLLVFHYLLGTFSNTILAWFFVWFVCQKSKWMKYSKETCFGPCHSKNHG